MSENDLVLAAEEVVTYVDKQEKIIGVNSDYQSAQKANTSRAVKQLKKKYGYKIQMLIPD